MARNNAPKIELTAYDDLFQTDESRAEAKLSKIRDIPISQIDEFPDHPFKVLMDEDMQQLVESIKRNGIMTPAIPMLAFFWLLAVCIQTPIFSIGIGLASIVPSVLMINTKAWFAYPMSYPFFVITSEYGKLATNLTTSQVELFPWIPVAIIITIVCLCISCFRFGQAERR